MESTTRVAIIGAGATVLAAVIAVVGSRASREPSAEKSMVARVATSSAPTPNIQQAAMSGMSVNTLPPRIVLHVVDDETLSLAQHLKPRLGDAGYDVPGIRRVDHGAAPRNAEVRYFRNSDATGAQRVVDLLHQMSVEAYAKRIDGYEDKVRSGQYEVWLPSRS